MKGGYEDGKEKYVEAVHIFPAPGAGAVEQQIQKMSECR